METTYKYTLGVKHETPEYDRHGEAYMLSGYHTYTVTCTHSQLEKQLDDFFNKGGKVISIEKEPAQVKCDYCHSLVSYEYYDFNHKCCMDCLEEKADEFTKKVIDKLNKINL